MLFRFILHYFGLKLIRIIFTRLKLSSHTINILELIIMRFMKNSVINRVKK